MCKTRSVGFGGPASSTLAWTAAAGDCAAVADGELHRARPRADQAELVVVAPRRHLRKHGERVSVTRTPFNARKSTENTLRLTYTGTANFNSLHVRAAVTVPAN